MQSLGPNANEIWNQVRASVLVLSSVFSTSYTFSTTYATFVASIMDARFGRTLHLIAHSGSYRRYEEHHGSGQWQCMQVA